MRGFILCSVKCFLTASDRDAGVPALTVVFSRNAYFIQLNNNFLNSCVRGFYEEKEYLSADIVFQTTGCA